MIDIQWWTNGALAFAGVLVVGALGNALWEYSKPLLHKAAIFIFRVLTLNRQRSRDRIYSRAAAEGRLGFSILMALMLMAAITAIGTAIIVDAAMNMTFVSLEAFRASFPLTKDPDVRRWAFGIVIFVVLAVTYIGASQCLSLHIALWTVAWFERQLALIGPKISHDQERLYRAAFARMKSEADYDALVKSLRADLPA